MLMAYVHVAHDCLVGDGVILSNAVNLAGHVRIDENAIIGGMTPVHQFVRIGAHAFVGGCSRIQKDVPPYVKAAGDPAALFGLNSVGLDRRGFPENVKSELKRVRRNVIGTTSGKKRIQTPSHVMRLDAAPTLWSPQNWAHAMHAAPRSW